MSLSHTVDLNLCGNEPTSTTNYAPAHDDACGVVGFVDAQDSRGFPRAWVLHIQHSPATAVLLQAKVQAKGLIDIEHRLSRNGSGLLANPFDRDRANLFRLGL